jgi:DNA-binding MarR family transcriptional regulator
MAKSPPLALDPLTREFLALFHGLLEFLWSKHNEVRKRHGLSAPQLGLLYHIRGMGPTHLSTLKSFVPGHLSALGQMTDRLVKRGWVRRDRDPTDRRCVVLTLTKKAERLLGRLRPFGLPALVQNVRKMPSREKRKALEIVRTLAELLGADPSKFTPLPPPVRRD